VRDGAQVSDHPQTQAATLLATRGPAPWPTLPAGAGRILAAALVIVLAATLGPRALAGVDNDGVADRQ
jgi:hypothetical protein